MKVKELYALTLKKRFVNELEAIIISGKLKPGSKLPTQREMAQHMGISRTVVNTGIAEMTQKGFLYVQPRIGTFVADYRKSGGQQVLMSILNCNSAILSQENKDSLNELYNCLCQLLVSSVTDKIQQADFIRLRNIAEKIKSSDKPVEAAQYAYEFYHQMSLAGDNTILPLLFASFKVPFMNLWEEFCREKGINALYKRTLFSVEKTI